MVRRILPAIVVVGLLAAGTSSFASQLVQQPTERAVEPRLHEAVASLRVLPKSAAGAGTADYEKFRQAEMQLIASPEILRAALDRPGIAELDALGDVEDKVAWLTNHIAVVAVPESEVVEIRLRGDDPREAALIVDAVATAYADTANKQWKAECHQRRDALQNKYKEMMAEVRERREALIKLVGPGKFSKNAELATQRSLLLDHLGTLRTQLTQLQRDVVAIDKELQRIGAAGTHEPADDAARRPEAVEAKRAELRMRRERLTQEFEETSKEFEVTSKEYDEIEKAMLDLGVDPEHEAQRVEIALLEANANRMADFEHYASPVPDTVEIIKLASSTDSSEGATGGSERSDDHSR